MLAFAMFLKEKIQHLEHLPSSKKRLAQEDVKCVIRYPVKEYLFFLYFFCTDAKALENLSNESKRVFDLWYFDCTDGEASVNLQNKTKIFEFWEFNCTDAKAVVNLQNENKRVFEFGSFNCTDAKAPCEFTE